MTKFEQLRLIQQKKLGVLLMDARQKSHKSLSDCAAILHILPGEYESIELGIYTISLPQIEILAYFFRLPVQHFFSDSLLPTQGILFDEKDYRQALILRNKSLATRIKMRREELGITLDAIASKIGVSSQYLHQLENGDDPYPVAIITQLAYVLDLSIKDFFAKKGSIGRWNQQQNLQKTYDLIPEEVQSFINNPSNEPYLRLAMHLSAMSTEKLRAIGEGLLEITF